MTAAHRRSGAMLLVFAGCLVWSLAAVPRAMQPMADGPTASCCNYAAPAEPRGAQPLVWVRIAGAATVVCLALFIGFSLRAERRRQRAMAAFRPLDVDS